MAACLAAVLAAAAGAQPRRDVFVAAPSSTQPGDFEVRVWSSNGSIGSFTSRFFAMAPGVVTAIERADADGGDVFVAAGLPAGGSAIYRFPSPFIRSARVPSDPPRVSYSVAAPDVITDFKYDPAHPGNPVRSGSLVVVGRDTSSGSNWLRRVSLRGGPPASVVIGAGATAPRVAIDLASGTIFVLDERGFLQEYTWFLALATANLLAPVLAAADVMWDNVPARPDPLVVAARIPSAPHLGGLFRVTPGAAPTATLVTTLPAPAVGVSVDGNGDGYLLLESAPNQRQLWHWDQVAAVAAPCNLPVSGFQAMTWSSRCTVEGIAAAPGTPIASTLAMPVVGSAGFTFQVLPPSGTTLGPMALLIGADWTESGPALGPNARVFLNPLAPGFFAVPLAFAAPPAVFVPAPLLPAHDGLRLVTQFVSIDSATNEPLTSYAMNFAIGVRPVD